MKIDMWRVSIEKRGLGIGGWSVVYLRGCHYPVPLIRVGLPAVSPPRAPPQPQFEFAA